MATSVLAATRAFRAHVEMRLRSRGSKGPETTTQSDTTRQNGKNAYTFENGTVASVVGDIPGRLTD